MNLGEFGSVRFRDEMPAYQSRPSLAQAMRDGPWRWRNLRSVGLKVGIWIARWHLSFDNSADGYGGAAVLQFGPIDVEFHYSIGEAWAERLEKLR